MQRLLYHMHACKHDAAIAVAAEGVVRGVVAAIVA